MRKRFKKFFTAEHGLETLEWVALLVVAAVLIAVLATMSGDVMDYMNRIGSYL